MHINIEVEKKKGSLELETFRFYLLDALVRLKLYEYLFSIRPSTRHKFRVKEYWMPMNRRNNTLDEAPLTEDIVEQARQQLVDRLAVVPVGVK